MGAPGPAPSPNADCVSSASALMVCYAASSSAKTGKRLEESRETEYYRIVASQDDQKVAVGSDG